MCGIVGYVGPEARAAGPHRGPAAARIPRLRLGRRGRRARRPARDPPERRQALAARGRARQAADRRRVRHRPHALGHARPADRGERASAPRLHAAASSSCTTASSRTTSSSSASSSREGHRFVTETDTEVVAHLVEKESRGDGLAAAVRRALAQLRGPVRARADLGRRSRHHRRGPQRTAGRRRPRATASSSSRPTFPRS